MKDKKSLFNRLTPVIAPLVAILVAVLVSVIISYYTVPDLSFLETAKLFFTSLWDANFADLSSFSYFIVSSTPLILTGLANAIAFRSGLFNIGVEGQFTVAMITTAIVGMIPGIPAIIHLPLTILAAITAGALWAFIPGFFKAYKGTNEVVNTIMMNYIAFHFYNYLVRVPFSRENSVETAPIQASATLTKFLGNNYKMNTGIFLALLAAIILHFYLNKTKGGYELRSTGLNPFGAEYGGINQKKNIVKAMLISGALAGLGAATQVMGPDLAARELGAFHNFGFNGIAVALLAKNNPIAAIFSGFLFGALMNAAPYLQMQGISKDIVYLMQGLVILFVAADYIWKLIRDKRKKKEVVENGK